MLPGKVLPESLYDGPLKQAIRSGVGAAFKVPAVNGLVDHLYGIVEILGKRMSRGSLRLGSPKLARLAPTSHRLARSRRDRRRAARRTRATTPDATTGSSTPS
jgi:hypothetical protein